MKTFNYVPILKAKRGELRALSWLRGRVRPNVLPVLELLPEAVSGSSSRSGNADLLNEAWGQRLLVDHRHIAVAGGDHVAISHAFQFYSHGLSNSRPVPILHPDSSEELVRALIHIAKTRDDGVAIRLGSVDLDRGQRLNTFVDHVLMLSDMPPSVIDLIVDFGALPELPGKAAVAETANRLAAVPRLSEWRTFVVAAGSFPENLARFSPGRIERTPRADWNFWLQLRDAGIVPRRPDFGDYAVQHPQLPPPVKGPRPASPSLRYTADNHWLVVRGMRHKGEPPRPSQFRDRCRELIIEREFSGRFLCEGDEAIARCAAGTLANGDQSYWRAVATDHHITLVWDRLSDLAGAQAA